MLGRRQGEVAPTRKIALQIEMPPSGRPRKSTLWLPASRRAASAPPDYEPAMVDRMLRFRPLARSRAFDLCGGLVSAREGWPTSEISSPNQAFHDSIRTARVIMP